MCTLVYCFLDSKNLDYLKRIYSQCFAFSQQLGHCHANVQFQFRDNFKTGAVRCNYNNVHITYLFCRDVFVLERPPYLALLCACEMWDMADINIKCAWQHNHPAQSSVHIVYSCSVLCCIVWFSRTILDGALFVWRKLDFANFCLLANRCRKNWVKRDNHPQACLREDIHFYQCRMLKSPYENSHMHCAYCGSMLSVN